MTLQSYIMLPNSVYLYLKLFKLQMIPHSMHSSPLNSLATVISLIINHVDKNLIPEKLTGNSAFRILFQSKAA